MTNRDAALADLQAFRGDHDATDALARWFDLPTPVFVDRFGGAWHRVVAEDPNEVLWFGSGDPIQVLLGIDGGQILVARGLEEWASLSGAHGVDVVDVREFGLSEIDVVRATVAELRDEVRHQWAVCDGCYAYGPVVRVMAYDGKYCGGCCERYLWLNSC